MYTQGPATADTCDMSVPAACCLLPARKASACTQCRLTESLLTFFFFFFFLRDKSTIRSSSSAASPPAAASPASSPCSNTQVCTHTQEQTTSVCHTHRVRPKGDGEKGWVDAVLGSRLHASCQAAIAMSRACSSCKPCLVSSHHTIPPQRMPLAPPSLQPCEQQSRCECTLHPQAPALCL